jgi:acyl-CoA thioester hydrolase
MDYGYKIDFTVRDYECDIQGVVNNGVYMNYLEHARHAFLLERGVDFVALAKQKINLMVIRAELDYKRPLTSGDAFWIGLNIEKISPLRFAFQQDIYHKDDNKLILKAIVTGTSINERGRPFIPQTITDLLTE